VTSVGSTSRFSLWRSRGPAGASVARPPVALPLRQVACALALAVWCADATTAAELHRPVRALVEGTCCWDTPPPPRRNDRRLALGVLGQDTAFVVGGVAEWGQGGIVQWRVGGVVYGMAGGIARKVSQGGWTLRGSLLTKDGAWWAHRARRGDAELETDLAQMPPGFAGPHTGNWARFERYAAGSMYLRDPDHLDMKPPHRATLDGVECDVYGYTPRQPVKVEEPHTVHDYRLWVDRARRLQLRADGLDEHGNVVRSVRCSDFVQRRDGSWVPLTVITDVQPGTTRGRAQWSSRVSLLRVEGRARTETVAETDQPLEYDVEFGGYKEVVRYGVFPGDMVLPKTITRYNEDGDIIMQLRFVEYDLGDLP